MPKSTEINEFVKKSNLAVKRISDQKFSVQGEFVFKTVRYELKGQLDLATRTIESFQHRLTWGESPIYDLVRSADKRASRSEYRFGKATRGIRLLVLNNERLAKGSLVTGFADGHELVPYLNTGGHCACGNTKEKPPRPVLAWGEDSSTRRVTVSVSSKIAPELEGLATVIPVVVERMSGGDGLGDILIDCINWIICYLTCTVRQIWCILTSIIRPGGDIFVELCSVLYGDCFDWCSVVGTSPA